MNTWLAIYAHLNLWNALLENHIDKQPNRLSHLNDVEQQEQQLVLAFLAANQLVQLKSWTVRLDPGRYPSAGLKLFRIDCFSAVQHSLHI